MWPQTTQATQQQASLSVVTTVYGVTTSLTNGSPNMTHDPTMGGIPTTNTVNSVGHPFLSTSANPQKQFGQPGKIYCYFPLWNFHRSQQSLEIISLCRSACN